LEVEVVIVTEDCSQVIGQIEEEEVKRGKRGINGNGTF
jgi:hypothetical protein